MQSKINLINSSEATLNPGPGEEAFLRSVPANIRLGDLDDTVFERIQRIPSILPQVKTLDKTIKYIDLRWKDANYIKLG